MQGFIHPNHIEGGLETTTVKFILRDFKTSSLKEKEDVIRQSAEKVLKNYPHSSYKLTVKEQYRNMYDIVNQHSHITDLALEAMKNVGVEPKIKPIRGGTDGAVLSFRGLPCPNLFACLLYTSPSPRDLSTSRMPSSA